MSWANEFRLADKMLDSFKREENKRFKKYQIYENLYCAYRFIAFRLVSSYEIFASSFVYWVPKSVQGSCLQKSVKCCFKIHYPAQDG